jgi:hypothetical protein
MDLAMMNHASEMSKESLCVKEPYVMEKGNWMFNPRNQAIHKESHITKCQSLLNQDKK